ncbi:MAG: hypothetical protein AAFW64_02475 [Pseudomonadota bacterium]
MLLIAPELRACAVIALGLGLTACGSGETLVVQPQEFTGPVTASDYVGRTFPVFVLIGESGDPSAETFARQGSITYVSANTVTLRLPGASPVTLTRNGSSLLGVSYSGLTNGRDPVEVLISGFSSTEAARLVSVADTELSVLGAFGFETAVEDRPASGTYSTAGAVFLTAQNVGAFLPTEGSGTLVADFTNGDISGTLLDATPVAVALAGDNLTPDDLAMTFFLENGVITPDGFGGDVNVFAELVVDGSGPPVVLGTAVTNDDVEGSFFGNEAEVIAGTFEADVRLSDGGGTLVDLDTAGLISGGRTGP